MGELHQKTDIENPGEKSKSTQYYWLLGQMLSDLQSFVFDFKVKKVSNKAPWPIYNMQRSRVLLTRML